MALKITTSFKEKTPEERELYDYVKSQFDYSSYIKTLIKEDIERKKKRDQPKEEKNSLIDF